MASSGSTVERGGEETTSGDEQLGVETLTVTRPPFMGCARDNGSAQGRCPALPPLPCACRLDLHGPQSRIPMDSSLANQAIYCFRQFNFFSINSYKTLLVPYHYVL